MTRNRRRASHSGFHFTNLYQNCPWKFFIRYVLKIVPRYLGGPLMFGSAVHYGAGIYLTTKSINKATSAAKREIVDRQNEHEHEEEYEQNKFRAPVLVEEWIRALGKGYKENFDIVASEKELRMKIPSTNDFIFTMVPDAVIKNEEGAFILELKTSSSSWKLTDLGVRYGDQATSYVWGVSESYKIALDGVLPNILYWNNKAKHQENITCFQSDLVVRTKKDIEEFKWSLSLLVTEIAQKIAAFEGAKYPAPMLFPRNTFYCNAFFRPCEYADICRTNLSLKGRAPYGFKRSKTRPKITNPMEK